MEAEEKIVFIMGDKIPSYYDVAISPFQVSTRRGDQGKKAINSYYKSLVDCWTKGFGTAHVLSRQAVIKKLEKVRDSYNNEVYIKCHRKKPKTRMSKSQQFVHRTRFDVPKSLI